MQKFFINSLQEVSKVENQLKKNIILLEFYTYVYSTENKCDFRIFDNVKTFLTDITKNRNFVIFLITFSFYLFLILKILGEKQVQLNFNTVGLVSFVFLSVN